MFKRPGVPFFTKLGVAIFFAAFVVSGVVFYVLSESAFFALKTGAFIGLAAMVIRWRIEEELVIKERKKNARDQDSAKA